MKTIKVASLDDVRGGIVVGAGAGGGPHIFNDGGILNSHVLIGDDGRDIILRSLENSGKVQLGDLGND